jgi:hypothetical protein
LTGGSSRKTKSNSEFITILSEKELKLQKKVSSQKNQINELKVKTDY